MPNNNLNRNLNRQINKFLSDDIIKDNPSIQKFIEAVKEVSGNTLLCGFYSYGEISPIKDHEFCELHNQTIAILTISES